MTQALYPASAGDRAVVETVLLASDLPCRAQIVDAAGLAALPAEQWADLSADALEDNPFFSREMVMAGIAAMGDGKGMKALVLRPRGSAGLAGVLPFRTKGIGALAVGVPALNLYQVGGTPLIARGHAEAAVKTLARLMAESRGLPGRWVFPHVALDGKFMQLFGRHAHGLGFSTAAATAYRRAVLTRGAGCFDAHMESVIGKKRAKDVARNLRRLGDLGNVRFERAADPETVAARVEAFLALEHAGWKGKRGTSFLSRPAHARFARAAFTSGLAVIDSLLLDDTPIAVSVNIGQGRALFTPKCAFDEAYRKYGPGMVLEYLVVQGFFGQDRYCEMDASTTVEGHVIAGFWDAEKAMGTVVAGPAGPGTEVLRAGIAAGVAGKARIKTALKRG